MLCDAPFKQIVDHRFLLKGLTWLIIWFLSLLWINSVSAGAKVSNTDVKLFTHGTVVETAKKLSQALFVEPQKAPEALAKIDYNYLHGIYLSYLTRKARN